MNALIKSTVNACKSGLFAGKLPLLAGKPRNRVDRYRELRATGVNLIPKIQAAAQGQEFDIFKVARKLTIPVTGRTLVFEGEGEMTALADFQLHEMRFGGKRVVDIFAETTIDLSPDERLVLEAHRASRCSLFEVLGVNPEASEIQMRDLLELGAPNIPFTDINLSRCGALNPGDLLFTRLISCDGINMSAGFFCGFRAVHRIYLLNAYEARMNTVQEKERSQRAFIFFVQKNREFGVEQAYQHVG